MLRGVRYQHLNWNPSITDAAFGHFQTFRGVKDIHNLKMSFCDHIPDKAFEHLRVIHTLRLA